MWNKLPNFEKEEVYSLKYQECEAIYVGKMKRNLKIRQAEYFHDFKNQKK